MRLDQLLSEFRSVITLRGVAAIGMSLLAACGSADETTNAGSSTISSKSVRSGYIAPENYPNASALLPPPPEVNSVAHALDEQISQQNLQLVDTARWEQATTDAKIRFPDAAGTFSCATGISLTDKDTPNTNRVLYRSMLDVSKTAGLVKRLYQRPRPFMVNREPICTPTGVRQLESNGAYPSGHSAVGWAWALILAEIVPESADRVLARGWEYGQSRVICNVHWQSDVTQGRTVGAIVVARMHGNAEFRADLEAARREIAAVRANGDVPDLDCAVEEAALRKEPST
jgi:acid phosphatase (class A)